MKTRSLKNWPWAKLLLALNTLVGLVVWIQLEGTGQDGDSAMHFYFAEAAWRNPALLLDLWAKPAYTFFAAPWAQGGFAYLQLFNFFNGLLASYFAYRIGRHFDLSLAPLLLVLPWLTRAYWPICFTGLTEPFAAMVLTGGVLLLLKRRWAPAYLLLSLLPFIRFELNAVLPVLILYGLLNRRWEWLLALSTTLLLALIGWNLFGSPFWFLSSTYDSGPSAYGSGTASHFFVGYYKMVGPVVALATLGGFLWALRLPRSTFWPQLWLILLPSLILFGGHALVWYWGVYASAGMLRVILPVFPFFFFLALQALEGLLRLLTRAWWRGLLVGLFVLTPITLELMGGNVWRYFWYGVLREEPRHRFLRTELADWQAAQNDSIWVFSDPLSGLAFNRNPKTPGHWQAHDMAWLIESGEAFAFVLDQRFSGYNPEEMEEWEKQGLRIEKQLLYRGEGREYWFYAGNFSGHRANAKKDLPDGRETSR